MYRLSGMTDSNNNTIVGNITCNAANQLLTMNYPGASEVRGYNVLSQLTTLSAGSENLTYTYPTGTNNGKVSSMYNAVSGETVAYTYDSLNRLTNATGSIQQTVQWEQGYVFDYFGNLLQKNILGGTQQQPSTQLSVSMTNNQITSVSGMSYDANGNASTSGMTYDAENRLATSGGLQYAYDGQNKRIWSWNGGLDGSSNPTGYSVSMYSPTGQKLATYQLVPQWLQNWNPQMWMQVTLVSSDQYFGGRRLAVLDQLGSAGTYFPWGEDKGSTNPQNTWSYATYWRDSGTNLDYANNRYYNNSYGRFMTPDPYKGRSGGAGDPNNPQSWNRYAYVVGDPVNLIDPSGQWWQPPPPEQPFPGDPGGGGGDCPPGWSENPEGGCIAPGSNPVQAPPKPPTIACDLQLFAQSIPNVPLGYHTYIDATILTSVGLVQQIFEATNSPKTNPTSVDFTKACLVGGCWLNNQSMPFPVPGQPKPTYSNYGKGTEIWNSGFSSAECATFVAIGSLSKIYPNNKFTYDALAIFGPNSNSFTFTLLYDSGVPSPILTAIDDNALTYDGITLVGWGRLIPWP
jgi:RHS repeat-associated protein